MECPALSEDKCDGPDEQSKVIKKSMLSEIIKYKKYSRGCTRTFSKKSSGNSSSRMSQHGVDDSTNLSAS